MQNVDPRSAGFWIVVWLVGLVALALVPTENPAGAVAKAEAPVYYTHGMTSWLQQDLTGALTVRRRSLHVVHDG